MMQMQCCDGNWIPRLGMEFQTEEEAWQFWKRYSVKMRFNARKRYTNKSRIDGISTSMLFVCSNEGKRAKDKRDASTSMLYVCSNEGKRAKDKRDVKTRRPRAETRTNCRVRLGLKFFRETNRFKVTDFISDHNHPLPKPEACHLLHYQHMLPEVELADETGVQPKQTHELMDSKTGGPAYLTFSITDHGDVLRDKHPKLVDNEDDTGGLCNDIEKLWKMGQIFDVTFEVAGERICAHSFMLAARSPVFKTLLFGPMAKAKTECIKIAEMKAEVFKALLHFVYTDKLSKDETPSVELLQDLFIAADRFSLKKLALLCEKQLEMNLSVDTVVRTLHLADQYGHTKLKKKCLEFASSPKNFYHVAVTQGYMNIMPQSPSLLAELIEEVNSVSPFAKKQRNG